ANLIADQGVSTTSYAVTGLSPGTAYFWRVSASNDAGTSAYSPAWSFTTVSPSPVGLIAAYGFDEGSGTTALDESGHRLNGSIVGATWTAGKYGQGLSFNGASSYIDLGNPSLLQVKGSMTWSAWVRAIANPLDDGEIIAKSDDVSGWQLKTTPDTGPQTFGAA